MKDVRDNPFSFLDDWYGRLDDIIEDLKNNGFDVLNATNEFIDVSNENDKEYVLKLGGTEKTITINKIEALDESLIPITEDGIYPVALYSGADEAFIKVVNEILGGNVSEVNNLELIPALGFGGGGRYWYRASIILDEETIVNFIAEESTPEAKKLLDSGDLIINSYSDISIDCSADKEYYVDGTTLDALNDSDANMEKLDNESIIIGEAIIAKLFESEDKIIKVLKEYEYSDNDDYIDESLIPIQECYDEDELASIYGGDSRDSQKAIADEMKELYLDEVSHPKLGKKIKQLKGWKIYQGTDSYGYKVFRCFTPDDDRPAIGYEDWETDTLEQAISWIENYDLKESKKPMNESNKELARIAFEDILKPFNSTDIKYTNETEDTEFKTHSYVANIISTPQYVELIKKLIDSDKYEYDSDFNDYVKYTEYGQITIIIEDKYITIEVMYNDDEDYFNENLIPIKESTFDNDFILDIVKMGYETGYQIFDSYEDFIEDEEVQDIDDKEAAWDFYCDLIDMGPASFYEEYRDELDFDPSFIAKYDEDYFNENLILIKEKNNDEKVIYKDNINIDMNVVITEDPNNSEYYNIYVDDDPTLFLQEPKSAVKKLKLTALDAVIDYYKAEHFSDTDY